MNDSGGASMPRPRAFGTFERMVAFRYLRARREEGFVSVIAVFSLLGIMLGVGTLIVVMSVFNGFGAEFLKQILAFDGDVSVLSRESPALTGFDDLVAAIGRVPGVISASPIVESPALLQARKGWSVVEVRGLRIEDLKGNADLGQNIRDGSLDDLNDDSVILGYQAASSLGVHIGDTVSLVPQQGRAPATGGASPHRKAYRVAATFDTGFGQFDKGFAFVSLQAAQDLFGLPDGATSIQVFVEDPENVARYRRPIAEAAGEHTRLFDWQNAASPKLQEVKTQRSVMFFILTLIIVVAAFNVISSLIMLVGSKGHDIAILRTMGATRGMILRIFFLVGASIGVAGTLLGLIAGLAFAENIEAIREFLQGWTGTDLFDQEVYFLSRLPAKIDPGEVAGVVVIALALSFLATIFPAWRAARLDPVEALRYE
jgi:lipoprotein-releasing system permease protein